MKEENSSDKMPKKTVRKWKRGAKQKASKEIMKEIDNMTEANDELVKKEKIVSVYMCGVNWQHEIGEAMDGNMFYPSVETLKSNRRCWKSCGIVEVKVSLAKWVEPQDMFFEENEDGSTK